ncbi:PH domain-containing protein [Heyndrickxia oleronia]|jgi:putative membrane protein|uniref:PH domain-containing protein n=1 Tax=Heyndrickxia oleronia TaxID=38875 RepID=UPI00242F8D63|nr:PH domain-containing protein [Heyndrickxia oleronia]MCI1589264.1 PH domain-containing protein [Heyndrickxia oleronia]MCI1612445.1 PH domain-containing protein [Heyndrickxia oleronia]MCI1743593.1 PH domain-containing protein [Heyndrickxia oleronia]MCI1760300.1 PH domain-containing protein [Heyndrickxia oleronia]
MSNHKRLHPITAISNFLNELKQLIVPFLISFFIGRGDNKEGFWDYTPQIIMTLIIVYVLISGIVKWLRFTYRLEEGELRIEYGLFVKKKRYIPFERIQSLDYSEGILHRPFGLVRVKIETAGNSLKEAEAELTAIKKKDAEEIQKIITGAKKTPEKLKEVTEEFSSAKIIYRITNREMFIMASTSGGAGAVFSALIAFSTQLDEIIPYKKIFNELGHIIQSGVFIVSLLVFISLLLVWLFSIIVTLLKYNGFTTKFADNNLIITRGLLEKRQTTIPLHRIQAIRITENPLRQLWGYATVYIESAGGSVTDAESMNVILHPMVKKNRINNLISDIFSDYQLDVPLKKAPKRAKNRYIIREICKILPISVIVTILFWPFGLLGVLLLLPMVLFGILRYRAAGWNIEGKQFVMRYRGFLKHTIYIRKNRIQSLGIRESWLQRKRNLASIVSTVKSSGAGKTSKVRHLDAKDVETIYLWFKN